MAGNQHLDSVFAALADPTRRAMIERLAGGECSVGDLSKPFDVSAPAISRHLRVLENAGLIERAKEARRSGGSMNTAASGNSSSTP